MTPETKGKLIYHLSSTVLQMIVGAMLFGAGMYIGMDNVRKAAQERFSLMVEQVKPLMGKEDVCNDKRDTERNNARPDSERDN